MAKIVKLLSQCGLFQAQKAIGSIYDVPTQITVPRTMSMMLSSWHELLRQSIDGWGWDTPSYSPLDRFGVSNSSTTAIVRENV